MTGITPEQKKVIDAVLSIFETGQLPNPDSYSTCTVLADGAGISYGKHQCTDRAGSLDEVVKRYIELGGTKADDLKLFMPHLASNASAKVDPKRTPTWLRDLISILKLAGRDPLMQQAQDEVFDRDYFHPALNHAKRIGLTTALGLLVVYDTCIHSGPGRVDTHRAAFPEKSPAAGGDEKAWVLAYIRTRRAWLAANKNPLVQKTVYRQDAMLELIKAGNWDLKTPIVCRGKVIS